MMQTAQVLADLVGAMRAYTGNGGAGPTIADNKMKLRKVAKHQKNLSKKFFVMQIYYKHLI